MNAIKRTALVGTAILSIIGCDKSINTQETYSANDMNSYDISSELNDFNEPFVEGQVLLGGQLVYASYQLHNGVALVEGDMIGIIPSASLAKPAFDAYSNTGRLNSNKYYWGNKIIPFTIASSTLSPTSVSDAIAHWERNTGLRFVPRTTEGDYIEFSSSNSGCYSNVGKTGGKQIINLGAGCGTGQAIHEIGHAVGLWHEQSRTDRNNFIVVNWSNIQSGKEHNFKTYAEQGEDGFTRGSFDFNSIMLYSSTAFCKRSGTTCVGPTLTRIDGTTWTANSTNLSTDDIATIYRMYPNVPSIAYQAHVQSSGWQNWNSNGSTAGTTGNSARMEAVRMVSSGLPAGVSVQYRAYVEGTGWQSWKQEKETSGTTGLNKRIEALQIRLTSSSQFSIQYRAHREETGWTAWTSNGLTVGSAGSGKRLEAIEVKIVSNSINVTYQSHIEGIGWQASQTNGNVSGTQGQSKRIEAIKISATGLPTGASVEYRAYVEGIGWQGWVRNNAIAGTVGQSKRLEAIQVRLVGAPGHSVQYQTHLAGLYWGEWAQNGATSGTTGQSRQVEAIRVLIQ